MAALNEIMDMIGGTVLQYEKELDSVQKDNEYLRRRLKEIEKIVESTAPPISTPAPSSPPAHLKWTSSTETETVPTEIYQNQVQSEQLTNTKVEEFSSHMLLVTESEITLPAPAIPNTLAQTNEDFETCALDKYPCDVKTEPPESLHSPSTNIYSPLPHCTSQLPTTTDILHEANPEVFNTSNSTDSELAQCRNVKAKSTQNPSVNTAQMQARPCILSQASATTTLIKTQTRDQSGMTLLAVTVIWGLQTLRSTLYATCR